jgi:hypothetical protein
VDELVKALGMRGISKSRTSELLDEEDMLSYAAFSAELWQNTWSKLPHGLAFMEGFRKIWHHTMPVSGPMCRLQKSKR